MQTELHIGKHFFNFIIMICFYFLKQTTMESLIAVSEIIFVFFVFYQGFFLQFAF